MIRKIGGVAVACALFLSLALFAAGARAIDGISIEVGHGDDNTSLLRLGLQDRWRKRTMIEEWRLAGYWDLSAAVWDNPTYSTADVGFTPVFRIERRSIYVEAAIGVHLVTTHISAARTFSTALQFGDHVGAGFYFGPGQRYDLSFRLQHLSNGHIDTPNPGINFWMVRLQYNLE
jgi:lipid A 3-O-deacylase